MTKNIDVLPKVLWKVTSIWQARIFVSVLLQINANDKENQEYLVKIKELATVAQRNLDGSIYDEITATINSISSATLFIDSSSEKNIETSIFDDCILNHRNGIIKAKIHYSLLPYYLQLKENFSFINPIDEYMILSSKYSQKLFEILSFWRNEKRIEQITISLELLYKLMSISNNSFKQSFSALKMNVLDIAERDINYCTSLTYRWETIKDGRKFVAIKFIYNQTEDQRKKLQTRKDEEHMRLMKLTNDCYKKHFSKKLSCIPNKQNKKCKFCLEEGRMKAERIFEEIATIEQTQ